MDQPLPETVAVGKGTALFLRGTVSGVDPREVTRIAIGDAHSVAPAVGWGLRRPGDAGGRWLWWALHLVPAAAAPGPTRLRASLETATEPLEADLGEVALVAGPGADGARATEEIRHRAEALARETRAGGEPVVAVAMATYEPDLEELERQIASLRNQAMKSWICLISDDCSSREAFRAIRRLTRDDPRFLVSRSRRHSGHTGNFERALAMVPPGADLVAPADQSGNWSPEKLSTLCGRVQGDVTLAYGDLRLLSETGEVLADRACDGNRAAEDDLYSLLASNFVPGSNSVFRREVLDYALPFPPGGSAGRYDHWLASTALAIGTIHFEDVVLADHHTREKRAKPRNSRVSLAHEQWRDVYFTDHARMLVAAAVLRLRGGERIRPEGIVALDAVLGVDRRPARALRVAAARARVSRRPAARDRSRVIRAVAKERRALTRRRVRGGRVCDPGPETSPRASLLGLMAGGTNGAGPPTPSFPAEPSRRATSRPLSVQIQNLRKTYEVPRHQASSVKQRLRHPVETMRQDSLTVLEDISFEVEHGEMFGILGRNGSGKSTLLRILAGIYGFDSGIVRVPYRIAPVIELGVGFEAELAVLDNVILNLEMLGFPEEVARARFASIVDLAGLEDFTDLKLRNFSSGMRARLAFAIAMSVNADLLLLDEVLAVGDPAFQRKCEEVFDEKRKSRDTTILLVTNHPSKIKRFCDRALLLEGGRIEAIGDTADVTSRYVELTLSEHGTGVAGPRTGASIKRATVEAWLEDEHGERALSFHPGEELHLHGLIEANGDIEGPGIRLEIRNRANAKIFAPPTLSLAETHPTLEPGERVAIETGIENKLAPGPYTVKCTACGIVDGVERAISEVGSVDFAVVPGGIPTEGVIDLAHSVRVRAAVPSHRSREED